MFNHYFVSYVLNNNSVHNCELFFTKEIGEYKIRGLEDYIQDTYHKDYNNTGSNRFITIMNIVFLGKSDNGPYNITGLDK